MFVAAGLDLAGQVILLALLAAATNRLPVPIEIQTLAWPWGWTVFCLLLYPSLGWLFGGYTVLRWRHLPQLLLLQRVLLTCVATLVVVAIARWLTNPAESIWLLHRRVQLLWLSCVCLWSLLVRISMRRGLVFPDTPQLLLVADSQEAQVIQEAWSRVPQLQSLQLLDSDQLEEHVQTTKACWTTAVSQDQSKGW